MIIIECENQGLRKNVFEFISLKFPQYLLGEIFVAIKIQNDICKFKLKVKDYTLDKKIFFEDFRNLSYEIRRLIFDTFVDKSFFKKNYGILTGVRPQKLASKVFLENSYGKSKEILKDKYKIPEEDIKFLYEIYNNQKEFYNLSEEYNLYIHIPFCPTRCNYCSFDTIIVKEDKIRDYVKTLLFEIEEISKNFSKKPLSIYIGGGTPTSIGKKYLANIIERILLCFGQPEEFSVECGRVDTFNIEILNMLKNNNVNRISVNPQSFNEKLLKKLNRNTHCNIEYWYNICREIGFETINMDLILGLIGDSKNSMYKSIEKVINLNPENITLHSFSLKNGSKLNEKNLILKNHYEDVIKKSKEIMRENNYKPYYIYRQKHTLDGNENIGYSKEGHFSIYNILMMQENSNIIGLGMSSSTKILNKGNSFKKHSNYKNLRDYIENIYKEIGEKNNLINKVVK